MMRTHRTVSTTMTMMVTLLATSAGQAAESGSALYIGGSQGFDAGATPPPDTYATVGTISYDGDVGAVIEGGVVDLNVGKTALAVAANALYVAPVGLFDGNLGLSATLPFASQTALEATASGAVTGNLRTNGWGIEQVTGDSGAGARLGDFKRRVYGLGPGLSYSGVIGGKVVNVSARHYREFAAENMFEGHITFVSGTMRF